MSTLPLWEKWYNLMFSYKIIQWNGVLLWKDGMTLAQCDKWYLENGMDSDMESGYCKNN